MRKAILLIPLFVLLSRPAHAADEVRQLLIPDALAATALVSGGVAAGHDYKGVSDVLVLGASATFLIAPSVTFIHNGEPGKAALSLIARAALPALGWYLGSRFADWNCARPVNQGNDTGLCNLAAIVPLAPAVMAAVLTPYLLVHF